MAFGLVEVRVRGFRSARDVTLHPGPLAALVGEASAGKSTLLAAIRALLDPEVPSEPTALIEGRLGRRKLVAGDGRKRPPVVFMPAELRGGPLVAPPVTGEVLELFRAVLDTSSQGAAAASFVRAVERCCELEVKGTVLLVEEPELFLRPQAQRYLYRLLHGFVRGGNQAIYSTHAPSLLNVGRLEELVLVARDRVHGTRVHQPERVAAAEELRLLTEFDAERSELFLARVAILVEGWTEKVAFPFVFRALGHDADREAVSIVECGGKTNIPLFARVCRAVGVPFVVVHDRDGDSMADRVLNELIAETAGAHRTVVLDPDFEAAAGLRSHSHKPEHAWRRFGEPGDRPMPAPLVRAAELALSLAR